MAREAATHAAAGHRRAALHHFQIISNPELVIAQCKNGAIGAFPALNARPELALEDWPAKITSELAAFAKANPGAEVAPFAINRFIHASNERLAHDLDLCEKYKVPLIIASLAARTDIVPRVHSWRGLVFENATGASDAKKAIEAGVDGLIFVCAGAGGRAGPLCPFALVAEVPKASQGPVALAGAIATGRGVLGARDERRFRLAGTRFIATGEANADLRDKRMIVASDGHDILSPAYFAGVPANYLRRRVIDAGLDDAGLDPGSLRLRDSLGRGPGARRAAPING